MSSQIYLPFWQEAFSQLKQEYINKDEEAIFNAYVKLEYIEDKNDTICVSIPSEFMRNRLISMGIIDQLNKKLVDLSGNNNLKIEFSITNAATTTPSSPVSAEPKKEPVKTESSAKKTVAEDDSIAPHPQLNKEFTFDSFVPGDNSLYAYNASLAASKNPGKAYNPILLYGPSGVGKTHLMHSIGNQIYKAKKGKVKLVCISAETFMSEFSIALKDKKVPGFTSKYRKNDVFLLDDIQFINGKEYLQDELFYTFDALSQMGAQMVFTCDRPLKELTGIKERVRTRFGSGVCIDMAVPPYEVRIAIIKKKLEINNKILDEEIINYIAKNITSSVRELEAAVKKAWGYEELIGKKLTIDIIKELLQDIIESDKAVNITIDTIFKVISDVENISVSDLKGPKRNKSISESRQIAVYLTRELLDYSTNEIGIEFGGRDHSTILTSYNKVADRIKIDPSFEARIKNIMQAIKDYKK
ncbi:MAG: chromosomal replication initiator protein DnaA [Treponema sp.]|nr:chromosomal replication initiator protein DnaA [Treponema sp.]